MPVRLHRLWVGLLLISGGIAATFLTYAAKDTWKFLRLSCEVPIQILSLSVKEIKPDRFGIEANYSYVIDGVLYQKNTLIKEKTFLNPLAAEEFKNSTRKIPRSAWYAPQDKEYSALERELPYKAYLNVLIALSVFVYFFYSRNLILKLLFFASQRK
jgi:hypothetical protein